MQQHSSTAPSRGPQSTQPAQPAQPPPVPRRARSTRRTIQGLAGLSLWALAALTVAVSSSGAGCSTPAFCPGGYIRSTPLAGPAGGGASLAMTCEGLCSPSECANPGNVCVSNHCELACTSELDCAAGQSCVPATTDGADGGTGAMVNICVDNGKAAFGDLCPFGTECAALMTCPNGDNCDYTQCNSGTCAADTVACEGLTSCTIGKCADGSACTVQGCPQAMCQPLVCRSAGVGDATAYCTMDDCHADTDCPGGYWCGVIRDDHQICGAKAQTDCGTSKDPCVMAGGTTTTYAAGPVCTLRNQCELRGNCAPCTTDIDCSLVASQHCTTVGSSSVCTTDCSTDADCSAGFGCTAGACVPRAATCVGTGGFCQPCRSDKDCTGGTYCDHESAGAESVCVLPAGAGKSCTTDADCPAAPSGLHGKCFDETVESSPGDGVYHTCYLPYNGGTDRFECWPGNLNSACSANSDCFSKKCAGLSPTMLGTCM